LARKTKGRNLDADVLEGILKDDPEAWRRMVVRHLRNLRAVVRLIFDTYREPVGEPDIDEVVTEVFRLVSEDHFRWLRELRTAALLEPCLRVMAAWRTLALLRSKYRVFTCALESEVKIGGTHMATAVLADPPEKERAPCVDRETADAIVAPFSDEKGRPGRILKGVYESHRTYAQIAEKEGIPVTTVAQTLFEQRKRLADELAAAAPEAGL
jgi:DNA-directed RNA polymerase specialized sigma24 family protein